MRSDHEDTRYIWAASVLNRAIVVLSLLLCVSLYKNISYPLLWNDESETAMTAAKILQYGYPKVHDGINVIFLPLMRQWVGYKAPCDANISIGWANYYFATIGVLLAKLTRDIYLQTALVRVPFATAGLIGLIVLALSARGIFPSPLRYRIFLAIFACVELCSVFLLLHMREARYYSLVILLSACFLYVCTRRFIHGEYHFGGYLASMTLLLVIAFNVSFVLFYIFCAALLFVQAVNSAGTILARAPGESGEPFEPRRWCLELLGAVAPVLVAAALLAPLFVFYETFKTSALLAQMYNFTFETYLSHLTLIVKYFSELELLYVALALKICALIGWIYTRAAGGPGVDYPGWRVENSRMQKFSFLLTSFIVIYSLLIANIPSYLFVRYYIVLQPVMAAMMITDLFIVIGYVNTLVPTGRRLPAGTCLATVVTALSLVVFYHTSAYTKGYIYQLTHQYKGPLDYIIPWIKENRGDTERLVVATNYEECSYMYYLGCRVTVGLTGKNLDEDLRYQPDILVERKAYGRTHGVFRRLLQQGNYVKVSFPVYDCPVNNIPDPFYYGHLFETMYARNENEKSDMYIRVEGPRRPAS